MKSTKLNPALIWIALAGTACAAEESYHWRDEAGRHTDLVKGDRPLVRYVYAAMDPDRREETHKPFHHVYDTSGKAFITKGPGGKYSHHRGIYFGFSKCSLVNAAGQQESIDTWHSRKGYSEHVELIEQATPQAGGGVHKVKIEWRSDESGTFITEERRLAIAETEFGLQIDFRSTLTTDLDEVKLGGDPQHAGFQFRASNQVFASTSSQTYFVRPGTGQGKPGQTINAPKTLSAPEIPGTRNLPWKGMSVVVGGDRYTIVYLDHPDNPKPADYSERSYGRFGSYFEATVTPSAPVTVNYRLFIKPGEMTADEIAALSATFVRGG